MKKVLGIMGSGVAMGMIGYGTYVMMDTMLGKKGKKAVKKVYNDIANTMQ